MKRILIAILAAIMLFSLTACGKNTDNTFTVKYIQYNPGIRQGTDKFYLVGEYRGAEKRKLITDGVQRSGVFKDCSLEDFEIGNGKEFQFKGVKDHPNDFMIDGGITLIVKDENGKTHRVKLDEGTVLQTEPDGDDDYDILLPEE